MALKISQSQTFWLPVTVMVPVDGGRHDKQTFDVQFVRMGVTEARAMVESIMAGTRTELDAFRDMIKGWRGVVDEDGEIPFSESALVQVLEIPTVAGAILAAYQEAISEVARRKN